MLVAYVVFQFGIARIDPGNQPIILIDVWSSGVLLSFGRRFRDAGLV